MKKKLLTIVLTAFGAFSAFAQFTAGNLAVYRYGDGTALANGVRVPVFVDEYTPSGTFVKTISIPRSANGGNYGFEGLGLTAGGLFEGEGFPVLSKDGATFSIIGYNPAQSGQFVIGTLDATGTWTANTLVVDAIGAPRSAVVQGSSVYFNGNDLGVRYKALGTTTASVRVSDQQNAPRVLTIAETIYNGLSATKIFAPIASTSLPQANLPTVSTVFSLDKNSSPAVPSIPSGNPLVSAHQVLAFKTVGGRTIIYVLDDNGGSPQIKKYRSNANGQDWVQFGNISVPANTKSIAGVYTANTGVTLYFTTYANTNASNASQLYSYVNAFTNANEADPALAGLTGSATLIATAPANTTFRGVTLAPGTGVLPVNLTAFNANEKNGTIRLNWTTASEKNNSHFEILRSSNKDNFLKIDQVSGRGNATENTNYAFVDEKPMPGVNYYQLKQVDFNGDFEVFGPVSATIAVEKTNFDIVKTATGIALQVYSDKAQSGKIEITDASGKVNSQQSINLEKGFNKVPINNNLSKGLAIITLKTSDSKITKKTIF
ncbi:T9SS type A sorting domain-containing protein [Pedobacter sp.]